MPETETEPRAPSRREPPPTTRQVYAIARALAQEACVPWPATRAEASTLITHLRGEEGKNERTSD